MRRTTSAVLSIALAVLLLGALSPAVAIAVDGTSITTHTIVPDTPSGRDDWYAETTPTLTITRIGGGLTIYGAGGHRISIESSDAVIQPPVEEGDQAYYYYAVDPVGNAEVPAHIFRLKIDTRPPVTTDDARAAYHGAALITLTATDPAPGSGVIGDDIFWSLDGLPSAGPIVTTSLPGPHTLGYASTDVAGNRELTKFVSFEVTDGVETTPTTAHTVVPGVPSGSAGWYAATPTVTITRTGEGLTYFGAGAHPLWVTSAQAQFQPALAEGDQVYSYFAVGSDGTTETPAHLFGLKLDTRPPVTTDDAVATYDGSAHITLSATDPAPGSGVASTQWTLDGAPGSGLAVATSASGTHTLDYGSVDVAGNHEATKHVSFVVIGAVEPTSETTRLAGADRYVVARNLAFEAFPDLAGVHDVVIACGSDRAMADPLSAAGLAGLYRAPVLLVQNDTRIVVPSSTLSALAAIKAAGGPLRIHVVGGPASVTAGHVAVLRAYGTIDRIGGADRYAVAAGVAARMRSVLGAAAPTTALVANGNMPAFFFHALVASPVAAHGHFPILLVKNGSVPPATAAALASYTTRYVIGGTDAVNAAAYAQAGGTTRLGGADRYAVAVAVAEHFTASGQLAWDNVGVAAKLADALTGGASMGLLGGPLLLTDTGSLPAASQAAISGHRSEIGTLYILGGTGSVSPGVEAQLRAALGL